MSGLAFFHPAVLWGLAFLAVPVAVHLFNRQRPTVLRFSTLRFFPVTAVRAQRARNIRRLLQLLARLLTVALLVLAFAGPYDGRDPFNVLSDPRTPVYCWVDPTISMALQEQGISRTALAASLLDSMDRTLPGSMPRYLYQDRTGEFAALGYAAGEIPLRHGAAGVSRMAQRLQRHMASGGRERPLLVVFSDFQTNVTASLDSMLRADTALRCPVLAVSLAPSRVVNFGVRGSHRSVVNEAAVQTVVCARGEALRSAGIHVTAAGMRAGQAVVSAGAGECAPAVITSALRPGVAGASVTVDAADGFPPDNTDYFTAGRTGGRSVLIVGDPAASFPLRTALGAAGAGYWDSVVVRRPEAVTADELESAALVVLDALPAAYTAVRGTYLSRSTGRKAILFSPGMDAGAMSFNAELLAALGYAGVVQADSSGRIRMPVLPDTLSPLWKGFPRLREQDVAIGARLKGLPGDVMVRMDDGAPLATALTDRNGNSWVLFSTPLGPSSANNLCRTGFFVALVDRLARFAAAQVAAGEPRWLAGTPYRNPGLGLGGATQVFTESNTLAATWDRQPLVVLDQPGLYRVQPFGQPSYWIAAVMDTAEMNLTYVKPAAPAGRQSTLRVVDGAGFAALIKEKTGNGIGPVIWLFIALLVIGEMLLWERQKKQGQ